MLRAVFGVPELALHLEVADVEGGVVQRMEENLGAVAIDLTPDDLGEIESAASKSNMQGERYPENIMQMVGR